MNNSVAKKKAALQLRASLYAMVRNYFMQREVLEVETPILSQAGNTDINIESFNVSFSGHMSAGERTRWLRTSPEYPLKRLLALGVGDCYELGRVFRNGEAGGRHNPEFTMLEWYRVGWDHRRLMDECVEIIRLAMGLVGRQVQRVDVSYRDLYLQELNIDPMLADISTLQAALGDVVMDGEGLSRDDWLDLLMTHRLQPSFAKDQLTVLYDYPASQCALAKIRDGAEPVAERFEVYLGVLELANGYHELTDGVEQRQRFEGDVRIRQQRGLPVPEMDGRLLEALNAGLPECAGVALGIDRLLMVMLDTERIADVLAFDFANA